ncbi:MAG: lysophospholipid acyltransferase family protein [Thermoanaerobaculaceae bacterium]
MAKGKVKAWRYALGYLLLHVLLVVTRFSSLGILRRVFEKLGLVAAKFAKKDCQRAREFLHLAFGEDFDCEALIREQAKHLGSLLGECIWLAWAPASKILAKTRFQGLDYLKTALAAAKGVVLVTGHCGNWEWMNLALQAAGFPMTVAGRRLKHPHFDRFITRLRSRFGGKTVTRGDQAGQALFAALRRRRVVGLLIDQDIAAPGVFVRFFGRPAWTPTGAAVFALAAGSPVIIGFSRRCADGAMEIALAPSIQPEGDARNLQDVAQLSAAFTGQIEDQIRARPEQWVWFHQRWRRQRGPQDRVWGTSE